MSSASPDKTLVLLRHAKAEQGLGVADHDRQLTDRGRADAQAAGVWLARHDIRCDLVICSTARRTRQTWDAAVRGGATTQVVEYRSSVYQGGFTATLSAIQEDGDDHGTILVVGHAPTMPSLAAVLSDGQGDTQALDAMGSGFSTAACAVLSYRGKWVDLGPGGAALRDFHVARA